METMSPEVNAWVSNKGSTKHVQPEKIQDGWAEGWGESPQQKMLPPYPYSWFEPVFRLRHFDWRVGWVPGGRTYNSMASTHSNDSQGPFSKWPTAIYLGSCTLGKKESSDVWRTIGHRSELTLILINLKHHCLPSLSVRVGRHMGAR